MRAFGPDDRSEAAAFYREVSDPTAKALLDFLIDHPDERFDAAALADRLGLPEHRAVARATYTMGHALRERGFRRPWTEAQQGYLLPTEQAALLRQARESKSA